MHNILIVDDDVPFCRAAAELLADRGFRVLGYAATARDAVAESRRLRPDGILLDVQLPDGYGVTLVPEVAVDVEVRDERIKLLRFTAPEPGRTIGLAWRRTSPRKVDFVALGQIVVDALATPSGKRSTKRALS